MSNNQIQPPQSKYNHNHDKHYLVQVNQQYKCVCQLCSCGKHRCPHPKVKGQFQTSYNSHYKNTHIIMPTTIPNYVYPQRHYHVDALKTNYKQSFNEKPFIQNEQKLKSSRLENIGKSLVRPNIPQVPFYGSSSYTEQFKPFVLKSNYNPQDEDLFINKRQNIPDYGFKSQVKFQDHTAYKQHYKSPQPLKIQKSPYPVYKKPDVPFKGSSSYKDQYKEYNVQPRYQQYSQSLKLGPKVKFQGSTTYNDLYKDFKVINDEKSLGKGCLFDNALIPHSNYLNSSPHIYYDEKNNKFI